MVECHVGTITLYTRTIGLLLFIAAFPAVAGHARARVCSVRVGSRRPAANRRALGFAILCITAFPAVAGHARARVCPVRVGSRRPAANRRALGFAIRILLCAQFSRPTIIALARILNWMPVSLKKRTALRFRRAFGRAPPHTWTYIATHRTIRAVLRSAMVRNYFVFVPGL